MLLRAPLKLGMDIQHSQLVTKVLKNSWRQGLGEDVRELQWSGNWKEFDETQVDLVTNDMVIDLNVFSVLVEHGICGYLNCRLIVAI